MSSRDQILSAVRSALARQIAEQQNEPTPSKAQAASTQSQPRQTDVGRPERVVELFADRVADYNAEVLKCRSEDLATWLDTFTKDGRSIAAPRGFAWGHPDIIVADDLRPDELDSIDAVLCTVTVAIAETGTIVLTHASGQGPRKVSLIPDHLLCVVREDQIVLDVPDALAMLDPRRPGTWISGPSATSDIELERVEGVHGPRRLTVLIVGRNDAD